MQSEIKKGASLFVTETKDIKNGIQPGWQATNAMLNEAQNGIQPVMNETQNDKEEVANRIQTIMLR